MTTDETALDVALLANSPTLPRWQRDALQSLVTETGAEITLVVLRESGSRVDGVGEFVRHASERFGEYPLWSTVGIVRTLTPDPAYKRQVPITTIAGIEHAQWRHCRPQSADGLGNELPADVVETVAAEADLAVRFGFGILKGDILTAPTHGVLSYHFGDIREYRGRPGGFWEFLDGESEVGVTVQQLSETLDGGRVVAMEHVPIDDTDTWQSVRRRCVAVARGMLVQSARRLADPAYTPTPPGDTGKLQTLPTGGAVVAYLLKNNRNRLRRLVDGE